MVILAQVSDLHIDGSEERGARAELVMRYLATLPRPVDAVLVTGGWTPLSPRRRSGRCWWPCTTRR